MPNPISCQHAPSCHYYSHKTTATSDKTAQTLPYFHIPPSVPQTSQRNHLHPILSGISHLPSRQHNQKARQSQHLPPLPLIPLPYQIPQGQQMPGSILDIPASQLALHKGIPPVRQMQHRVGLQAIPVVVMRQHFAQRLRINLQIPNAHTLIHEPERLQIQLRSRGEAPKAATAMDGSTKQRFRPCRITMAERIAGLHASTSSTTNNKSIYKPISHF